MRAVGSFIVESGCGWLPFWLRRLDDQAAYVFG